MTEIEYVKALHDAASGYRFALNNHDVDELARTEERWHTLKMKLSPSTMVALCDTWLGSQGE